MHPMRNTYLGALRLLARADRSIDDEINAVRSGDHAAAKFHGRAARRQTQAASRLLDAVEQAFDAEVQR